MKLQTAPTSASITRYTTDVEDFSIRLDSREAVAHMMSMLSNLYSDRYAAVVREYSTNARDSHIEAGQTRPIRVMITEDNELVIEDWGVGLSRDQLRDLFGAYGSSSKRDDDSLTGALGVGSKSALTITDTFTIRATQGGVTHHISVIKDAAGIPTMHFLLSDEDSAEADGVRITIPLRPDTVRRVQRSAETFFGVWPADDVECIGFSPLRRKSESQVEEGVWIHNSERQIVQGGVTYEVGHHSFPNPSGLGWTVTVPVGSVDFTPSRENLTTTDRTVECVAEIEQWVSEWGVRILLEDLADLSPVARSRRLVGFPTALAKAAIGLGFSVDERLSLVGLVPDVSYRRKLSLGRRVLDHIGQVAEPVIVAGFRPRNLTRASIDRTMGYLGIERGAQRIIFVRSNVADMLDLARDDAFPEEGRVYAWSDVLASTRKKRSRGKTLYEATVTFPGGDTRSLGAVADLDDVADEIDDTGDLLVVWVAPGSDTPHTRHTRHTRLSRLAALTERPVLAIKLAQRRQQQRVERLFGAEGSWEEVGTRTIDKKTAALGQKKLTRRYVQIAEQNLRRAASSSGDWSDEYVLKALRLVGVSLPGLLPAPKKVADDPLGLAFRAPDWWVARIGAGVVDDTQAACARRLEEHRIAVRKARTQLGGIELALESYSTMTPSARAALATAIRTVLFTNSQTPQTTVLS